MLHDRGADTWEITCYTYGNGNGGGFLCLLISYFEIAILIRIHCLQLIFYMRGLRGRIILIH